MVDQEPLYPGVNVFMTKEKALWHEMECGDSQQGSNSEGTLFTVVLVRGNFLKSELAQVAVKSRKKSLTPRRSRWSTLKKTLIMSSPRCLRAT